MQEARKSLIATAAVVAVAGATVVGGLVRNRMEIGPGVAAGGSITMESLVSSTDGIPDPSETAKNPISESTFFYQLTLLLEREYVDGVQNEIGLATGAVRGMVLSLADSDSVFMKPEQMAAMKKRQSGLFEGIGIELKLVQDEEQLRKRQEDSIGINGSEAEVDYDPLSLIPTVVVTTVVPGGPAEKAGLRVGDRILKVNGKYALSSEEVGEARAIRAKFDTGEIDAAELQEQLGKYVEKFELQMSPTRVLDALQLGKSGTVEVSWRRGDGRTFDSTITKSETEMPAVEQRGDEIALRFFKGADAEFAKSLEGRDGAVLDLRQSTMGDFGVMRKCLALLVPAGLYGTITREQAGSPRPFEFKDGVDIKRDIVVRVDSSTSGAAAVFAHALVSSGLATLEGDLTERLPWIEVFDLPDGSGYTLRTGTFVPKGAR